MADEFDPLKQTDNKPLEELYATVQKKPVHNDDDLLRPEYESVLKRIPIQTPVTPTEKQLPQDIYQKLDFISNAPKAPVRSTNPFNDEVQKSSSSSLSSAASPPQSPPPKAFTPPPPPITRASEGQASSSSYWDNQDERYHQDYEPRPPPPPYYSEEYYEDDSSYRKKRISTTIDRIIQRFPVFGLFYKPSTPPEMYETEQAQEYVEEYVEDDQVPQLVDATTLSRELTADELNLNERYSNKSRTQIINLQVKDQTQPVDVSIHHDSYTIYSCDVGRSVVEIFDMYGKLQHVIDDNTTTKFQPTAIVVGFDGTVVVASHFGHRLHMYSPESEHDDSHAEGYHFRQYKLGAAGHDIHEFHHPAGMSIDYSDGYLYICDRGNYRIQVLRPEGVCERVIDLLLNSDSLEQLSPVQLSIQQHGDQIVCVIGKGDAICFIPKYTNGEVYVDALYITDNDGLGLLGASGIAIDHNDRIFISDTGHNRIVICTPEGGYITHFGTEGSGPGELKRPCGLDITADGTIVVADSGNKRLQLFGSIREQADEEPKKSTTQSPDDSKF
ncbi:unnamed protein product [Adineta steineri]|uniref:Uncharacterized protein n=1 Tax=Adineta steineri TaxID=433720 RepID=A0A818U664_9BILA|nr:unnamed protein product [Adineta steineri]